jgi:methionyl-tRNA formyltransferase
MLKVVIIGYGEMFANMVAGVLDSGSNIVGVLRHDRIKYPRFIRWIKDMINPDTDYSYIKSYHLHEIKSNSVNSDNFRKQLLKLNPDIMIVASWSEKIDKLTYDMPKTATINVHPSLLPKYRGPNPYMQVIKNREKKSGVTLHLMTSEWDSGAILDQREVEILDTDTGKELKSKTSLIARGAICELLQKMSEDVVFPISQNEQMATYYSKEYDCELDFSKPIEDTIAQIRGIHPWGRTYFYHKKEVFVPNPYRLTVIESDTTNKEIGEVVSTDFTDRSITIVCPDNKLLRMGGLKLYGTYKRFLTKGYIRRAVKVGDKVH